FFHHDRDPGVSLYDLRQFLVARKQDEPAVVTPDEPALHLNGDVLEESDAGFGGLGLVGTGVGGGGTGVGTVGLGRMADKKAMPRPAAPMRAKAEERKEASDDAASIDAAMAMSQPISLRSLFATTAYFNAEVTIDASG